MRKILFVLGITVSFIVNGQWSQVGGTNSVFTNNYGFNTVRFLKIDKQNNLYAAGDFTNASGHTYVAKWDGINWSELGGANSSSFNGTIMTLTTDTLGNIYAAWRFKNNYGYPFVAKWNGSYWSEVGGMSNPLIFNGDINTITVDIAGYIYVAGAFTNPNGFNFIAKWDRSNWVELGTSYFTGSIYSVNCDIANNIYAGGDFKNLNGKQYVAKWNGVNWSELTSTDSSYFGGRIYVINSDKIGNIYAGGWFVNSLGYHSDALTRWSGNKWVPLDYINDVLDSIAFDNQNNVYYDGYHSKVGNFSFDNVYQYKYNSATNVTNIGSGFISSSIRAIAIDDFLNLYVTGDGPGTLNGRVYKWSLALPLKLLSFTAKLQHKTVLLNWQTANEINVSHINIQRSLNGKDFTSIGKVNASCCSYEFTDHLATSYVPLATYYRLEIVDKDGSKTYSKIRQIKMTNDLMTNDFKVYPNPAKDVVNVVGREPIKELLIIDYLGREISRSFLTRNDGNNINHLSLNINHYPKGLYMLQIITKTGEVKNEKLIIE